jgi:hypothetical protein
VAGGESRKGALDITSNDGVLQSLLFSMFLGGKGDDEIENRVLDTAGNILVSCRTTSRSMPVKNAYAAVMNGDEDGYLPKFSSTGKSPRFNTRLGGSGDGISAI